MASDLKEAGGRTRLFVGASLEPGGAVTLDEGQSHYLLHVLRAKAGDRVLLFNGRDGEWQAEITATFKRGVTVVLRAHTAQQTEVPDVWLLFAPVKKTPSDYLAQKATELGARKLQPVFTRRTIVTRINQERLKVNAVEAAEQSARLTVPEIGEALALGKLLDAWPRERRIFFCDEGGDAKPLAQVVREAGEGPCAILTGPEGGFDPEERENLRRHPFVTPVTLGPRILRADTAALAALAIWQSAKGDFA
ncbi:MAG TPA: 16S rRNA (uracil(1498)-N(3))-methyltransferase [Rhizomicrobium sp.]|jgi:16S rRNA (uracil1498-N3)-methyltransferase|nr:16S rRNA (uracil(1498)-N(3))-methyltransferase [Rhizomicrobium sp.]